MLRAAGWNHAALVAAHGKVANSGIGQQKETKPVRHLAIQVGTHRFVARLEEHDPPRTRTAFLNLLPFEDQVVHSRCSGEAARVPLGELDTGLGPDNHANQPSRGDVLLYLGGSAQTESLFAYGSSQFASKMGQLAGNHFLSAVEGSGELMEMGRRVLWQGAQPIRFEDLGGCRKGTCTR